MRYNLSKEEMFLLGNGKFIPEHDYENNSHIISAINKSNAEQLLNEKKLFLNDLPTKRGEKLREIIASGERKIQTIHSGRTDYKEIDYFGKEDEFIGIGIPFSGGEYLLMMINRMDI